MISQGEFEVAENREIDHSQRKKRNFTVQNELVSVVAKKQKVSKAQGQTSSIP